MNRFTGVIPVRHYLPVLALLPLVLLACEAPAPPPAASAVEAPPSLLAEGESPARVVRLDAEQRTQLAIETAPVATSSMPFWLLVPAEVAPAPEHFAYVSAPISGRVVRLYAHEGEAVKQGQVLLELESLEYATLVAEVLQARAEQTFQQAQVDRLTELVDKKIAARSTLEKAEADLSRARAGYAAAHARVSALGLSRETVDSWSDTNSPGATLPVRAPISGQIELRGVDLGQAVAAYEQMISLINPVFVHVHALIPPEDAGGVQAGDTVFVVGAGAPARPLGGTVASVNPALGEDSRSVVANIHVTAIEGWPRPGQAVQVRIQSRTSANALSVPLAAILYEGSQASVFVRTAEDAFEQRIVSLGRLTEDRAEVLQGLQPGEAVAVTQVFNLKALSRFEQFGEE